MQKTAPDSKFPRIYVDFNACGFPGVEGRCYFAYSEHDLQKIAPKEGMTVCAYMESDELSVVGCLTRLEFREGRWLFHELADSWFEVTNENLNPV
jgi:hypothetical protein